MRELSFLRVAAAALVVGVVLGGCGARQTLTTGPTEQVTPIPTGSVASVLNSLSIRPSVSMDGYSRDKFGAAWTDDNDDQLGHNGCDTRNDILRRDLTGTALKADTHGCVVLTGTLADPYTGTTIPFTRGVTTSAEIEIDHVVPLGDAWESGAQDWAMQQRVDLANDPLNLLAVSGRENEAKGDSDAASWLPPNVAYDCPYVARQVAVKARYKLAVTQAEHDAIGRVLETCPGQALPTG